MSITLASALLYVADVFAKKYTGNYLEKGVKMIVPKKTFKEQLRVVIQKTVDEFIIDDIEIDKSKFNFSESELVYTNLLEYQIYNEGGNPLTEDTFKSNSKIAPTEQVQLDKFYKIFIKKVESDKELRKIYVEENYKEAIFEFRKKIDEHTHVIKEINANTLVSPQIVNTVYESSKPNLQFYYRQRLTSFIGRENELKQLKDFSNYESKFTWWLLTGLGGAGKSRLAFEFVLEMNDLNIECGFISFSQINKINWQNWYPKRSTIYIIDYAANNFELSFSLIKFLADRNDFDFPVKILLIEREKDGEWWSKSISDPIISNSLYNEVPLNLG